MSYKISFDHVVPEFGILPLSTSIWMGPDGGAYLDAFEARQFTIYAVDPDGEDVELVRGTYRGDEHDRDYPLEMTHLFWSRAERPDEPRTEQLTGLEPLRLVYDDGAVYRWHRQWHFAEKVA